MKNYSNWAFIPPQVRYCPNLTTKAILLFGEIAALSHQTGYCFASNAYFAELFGVTERTIRNWINQLKKTGFVNVEIERNHKGTRRSIYLAETLKIGLERTGTKTQPSASTRSQGEQRFSGGEEKHCHRTTTSTSKTFKKKKNYKKKANKRFSKQSKTNRKGDVSRFYNSPHNISKFSN